MKYFSAFCLALLGALIAVANVSRVEEHRAGVMAADEPLQGDAQQRKPWKKNGYLIRPLATFSITARTLLTTRYRWGREAEISPIDLTLGWGPMSDSAILSKLSISRGNRSYHWKARELPLTYEDINNHAANMHLIPASSYVENKLLEVIPGNLVEIKGYLIQAAHPDGWSWTSSLSREDSGNGACEVVWVDNLRIFNNHR
jgi:hypothetical protein